jgi:pimeloyl-ACP methyl ester carboxylesterase
MRHIRLRFLISFLGVLGALAVPLPAAPPTTRPYLLHLNGIGGKRYIDQMLTSGLKLGGLDADFELYDWTGEDEGLVALGHVQRHVEQSAIVEKKLEQIIKADPNRRVIVTSHSGGSGIAAWALEQLPADMKIDTLVMIQPALSPKFDLSKALTHVRGHAYAFISIHDELVLGFGTRMLGTVDRVQTDAAGRVGFVKPDGADAAQYEKLVQIPYDTAWLQLGNMGDHIGPMFRPFAKMIISPLLQTGVLPVLPPLKLTTTQPTTSSASPLPR